jgi:hypothetical protein
MASCSGSVSIAGSGDGFTFASNGEGNKEYLKLKNMFLKVFALSF